MLIHLANGFLPTGRLLSSDHGRLNLLFPQNGVLTNFDALDSLESELGHNTDLPGGLSFGTANNQLRHEQMQ